MVIVRLSGGLGNQMFQYAAARRIACVENVPLKLDISRISIEKGRTYSLGCFNIEEHFATAAEVRKLRGPLYWTHVTRYRHKNQPYLQRTWLEEKHFHFDPELLNVGGDVYLQGWWQTEKYFTDVADVIRHDFTVKESPSAQNVALAEQIRHSNAVSVHVRRGDYVTNSHHRKVHGLCSLDYYQEAVKRMSAQVADPHFYIFSDDPEWTQTHLKVAHPTTYVTHNDGLHGHEDIRLMSLCKHHIIANSSFSWWGAWLANNPDQRVYAPPRWFDRPDWAINTRDLLPERWQQIDI